MLPFVVDHIWTRDSHIFPLTLGGNTGPYIDQGESKLKVHNFHVSQNVNDYIVPIQPFKRDDY